jgi:hypothetical protein
MSIPIICLSIGYIALDLSSLAEFFQSLTTCDTHLSGLQYSESWEKGGLKFVQFQHMNDT